MALDILLDILNNGLAITTPSPVIAVTILEEIPPSGGNPRPFMWTATAQSILAKLERLCKVINGTQH